MEINKGDRSTERKRRILLRTGTKVMANGKAMAMAMAFLGFLRKREGFFFFRVWGERRVFCVK